MQRLTATERIVLALIALAGALILYCLIAGCTPFKEGTFLKSENDILTLQRPTSYGNVYLIFHKSDSSQADWLCEKIEGMLRNVGQHFPSVRRLDFSIVLVPHYKTVWKLCNRAGAWACYNRRVNVVYVSSSGMHEPLLYHELIHVFIRHAGGDMSEETEEILVRKIDRKLYYWGTDPWFLQDKWED